MLNLERSTIQLQFMVFVRIFLRVLLKQFFHISPFIFMDKWEHQLTAVILIFLQRLGLAQNRSITLCLSFALHSAALFLDELRLLEQQADNSLFTNKIRPAFKLLDEVAVDGGNSTLGFAFEAG